jgi:hypothetical protein
VRGCPSAQRLVGAAKRAPSHALFEKRAVPAESQGLFFEADGLKCFRPAPKLGFPQNVGSGQAFSPLPSGFDPQYLPAL